MNEKTREYLNQLLNLHKNVLYTELDYLKKKNEAYHEKNFSQISEMINSQKQLYEKEIPHFYYFENHKQIISKELFGRDLGGEESERLGALLNRDDFLIHFFTKHEKNYSNILEEQHQALWRNEEGLLKKIRQVYHKGSKTRLVDFFHREEELFSEFLELYMQRAGDLQKMYNYYEHKELHDKLETYVLKGSMAVSAVPLGPLELLSLPLWGTYISMHELENLSSNFSEWRKINKARIIKEEK